MKGVDAKAKSEEFCAKVVCIGAKAHCFFTGLVGFFFCVANKAERVVEKRPLFVPDSVESE